MEHDYELIDNQLARAQAQHLTVTLCVLNGFRAPAWLASQSGMQEFQYTFQGNSVQMPVPWNQTYLNYWTSLITLSGERYDGNATIGLVHMTNSSTNGFEMQLPDSTTDMQQWQALGYSTQKEVSSWDTVIDAFRKAFPTKPLDTDVHPVLGADTVAQQVVSYGYDTMGNRFGVLAAWWNQGNTSVYPGMYALLKEAASRSFATVQLVTNATDYPNDFGPGGIQQALNLAESIGVRYFEVWDVDLKNSAYTSMLQGLHNGLSSGASQFVSAAQGNAAKAAAAQIVSQQSLATSIDSNNAENTSTLSKQAVDAIFAGTS